MKSLIYGLVAVALVPVASAVEISVSYSDDFAEKLSEDYGEKEGTYLSEAVSEDLRSALALAGVKTKVDRVDVVIIDAQPNHPTMEQARQKPGLDMLRSRSLGGMKLQGTAFDADGNVIGTKEYGWFENDIRDVFGAGTWTDAKRASNRFSRKLAEDIAGN
ncbi:MAG: hypothetical protein GYB42_04935 [Alphaproteobacteria bacterium]|nr:hypothetical protein [Alphaproteobacteria bacterium]